MVNAILKLWIAPPRVEEEGGLWASYCDDLGLYGCGSSENEARMSLYNARLSYCNLLMKRGMLDSVLKEKKIKYEIVEEEVSVVCDRGGRKLKELIPFAVQTY